MKQKLLIAYAVTFILATLFYSVAFPQQRKRKVKPEQSIIKNQISLITIK